MKISVTDKRPAKGDVIVLTSEEGKLPNVPEAEFKGAALSLYSEHKDGRRVVYAGLGKAGEIKSDTIRKAVGAAVKKLAGLEVASVVLELDKYWAEAQAAVEGAYIGAYKYEEFLPEERRRKIAIKSITLVAGKTNLAKVRAAAKEGEVLGEATNLVRKLGDSPGNVIYPETLATRAQQVAKANGLSCKVWTDAALKKDKFGGLLAVGGGSVRGPRFIEMRYNCRKAKAPTIAVVGKAITFDTGGISIKPDSAMDEMKFDKMGGCAVLGIMQAVAKLKLPVNVVGLISSAENMPDGAAYRPGDIVTTFDGQTVEVLNTDAEGRIVLADALGYARTRVKPDYMIDMATLTGAVVVALGMDRAGVFTEDEKRRMQWHKLGEQTGDRVWPMPVGDEYDEQVKSDIATVKNLGNSRWGGACTAASFLKTWVGDIPWTHLDIAGTAWATSAKPYLEKGATGAAVRLVTAFLKEF